MSFAFKLSTNFADLLRSINLIRKLCHT